MVDKTGRYSSIAYILEKERLFGDGSCCVRTTGKDGLTERASGERRGIAEGGFGDSQEGLGASSVYSP